MATATAAGTFISANAAAIGAGVGAVGLATSVVAQTRAAKADKKAAAAQTQQQNVQARASRRQAIRRSRAARAESLVQSQALGSQGSSGEAGGIGSLSSQLGSQIGLQGQQSALSGVIGSARTNQARFGNISSIGGALANFGGSIRGLQTPAALATPDLDDIINNGRPALGHPGLR